MADVHVVTATATDTSHPKKKIHHNINKLCTFESNIHHTLMTCRTVGRFSARMGIASKALCTIPPETVVGE